MASTSTPASRSRSTSTSTSKFSTTVTASTPSTLQLSANFAGAHTKSHAGNSNAVGYDHETYLQLTAGEKAKEKTPNQVYREVSDPYQKRRNAIDVIAGASSETHDEGIGSSYPRTSGRSEPD